MPQQRTCTIPDVKAALVDPTVASAGSASAGLFRYTLRTAGELTNSGGPVQVLYGDHGPGYTGYDLDSVTVGGSEAPTDEQWATLGSTTIDREETYVLAVDILSIRTTCKEATERAFAIHALLEAAIVGDVSMGLATPSNLIHLLVQPLTPRHDEIPLQGGWLAHVHWGLLCQARI